MSVFLAVFLVKHAFDRLFSLFFFLSSSQGLLAPPAVHEGALHAVDSFSEFEFKLFADFLSSHPSTWI